MLKINRLALSLFVIGGSAVVVTTSAFAGVANSDMTVSADVTNVCTINAGALTFAGYDPTSNAAQPGTANLTVTCTSGAGAQIDLGEGVNAASGSTNIAPLRRLLMNNGTNHFVNYQLYSDPAHTIVWAATATHNVVYTGTGTATTVTAHALIPGNQGTGTPAGLYQDTIQATVNF